MRAVRLFNVFIINLLSILLRTPLLPLTQRFPGKESVRNPDSSPLMSHSCSSTSCSQFTENLFCAGTYQKILACIAKPALENADVKLLTKVVKIDTTQEAEGKVTVTTDTQEILHFDEVIITTPLGWLKKNQDAFTPPLPARLAQAINSISYGCLEKVSLQTSWFLN